MKSVKSLLFILLLLISVRGLTQDFDRYMVKKQLDCPDISLNSAALFEKYYTENKIDSAKTLLTYWQNRCGLREPVQRAKLLLALQENSFQDSILAENVLFHLFNFKNRTDLIRGEAYHTYDDNRAYFGYIPLGREFDLFTKKSFNKLKEKFESNSIEYLLCEFYGDNCDTIFSKIQTGAYPNSILTKEYYKEVNKFINLPELHMSFITGIWIPTGKAAKLGLHPELGYQMGIKRKKMNYDIIMSFKFGKAANSYIAFRKESGEYEETNHFFGGHIGLDIGRDIYSNRNRELQLVGGIAFDGFDALKGDVDKNIKSVSVSSYNFNIGVAYRYYITSSLYLGLRAKYNIVDYTKSGVIDFTGNPITIQFSIGGVNNLLKHDNLKILKYKLRR